MTRSSRTTGVKAAWFAVYPPLMLCSIYGRAGGVLKSLPLVHSSRMPFLAWGGCVVMHTCAGLFRITGSGAALR